MSRARNAGALLGLLALFAAGCGGGDTVTPTPTPTPGGTTPGGTVGGTDPGLDANGQPIDTTGSEGVTATIPDLEGSNLGGGFGEGVSDDPYTPKALTDEDVAASDDGTGTDDFSDFDDEKSDDTFEDPKPDPTPDPKPVETTTFSGAKIYVNGVVHDVDTDGTFPADDPILRLLSVKAGEIEVELIAGEFTAGGGVGVFLDKGELVSMLNGSEQVTYRVKYLRPITASTNGL